MREWSFSTTRFAGTDGRVRAVYAQSASSQVELPADLVLLAMGFTGVRPMPLLGDLGVELGPRSTIVTDARHQTTAEGVFAAGDARRGASLIVWAIREGRDAALAIERYLARRPQAAALVR